MLQEQRLTEKQTTRQTRLIIDALKALCI